MSNEQDGHERPRELSFECELGEPPEQVWRALTEPALLAAWLMPNDFRAELGAEFTFQPEPGEAQPPIACKVLAIDPPRLLRLSWQEQADERAEEPATLVTFQLTRSASGGTRLQLVHNERSQQGRLGQLLVLPLTRSDAPRMRCAA